jgi:FG-GAP-like repeat
MLGIAAGAALAFGWSASGAVGVITLQRVAELPVQGLTAARVVDLNEDGRPDVVGSGPGAWVFLNDRGTLAPGVHFGSGGGTQPAIADLNRDGHLDVVLAGPFGLSVLLGDGLGRLVTSPAPQVPNSTVVAAGDVNGDGNQDLVVGTVPGFAVFLGDGAAGFTPAPRGPTGLDRLPTRLALADLNRDGRLDLMAADPDLITGHVEALIGDGTGRFGQPRLVPAGNTAPSDLATADMNGDGITDVVTLGRNPTQVTVAIGDGTGSFSARESVPLPNFASAGSVVGVGDVDQDGDTDVVVGTTGIAVLENDGSGGLAAVGCSQVVFAGTDFFPEEGVPGSLAVADFDGDARGDIAMPLVGSPRSALQIIRSLPGGTPPSFPGCMDRRGCPPRFFCLPFPVGRKRALIGAVRLVHLLRGRALAIRVTANRTLALGAVLWRGRSQVTAVGVTVNRGANRIAFAPRLKRGAYRIVLSAYGADGGVAEGRQVAVVVR